MSDTLTVEEYADKYVTPAMLRLLNLEDTPENRTLLDEIVQALPEEEDL